MGIIRSERGLDLWYMFQYRVLDTYPGFIAGGALTAALASWLLIDDISVEAVVASTAGGGVVGAFGKWGKNRMDAARFERDLREYETGGNQGGV